jgi:hypothetical protein
MNEPADQAGPLRLSRGLELHIVENSIVTGQAVRLVPVPGKPAERADRPVDDVLDNWTDAEHSHRLEKD